MEPSRRRAPTRLPGKATTFELFRDDCPLALHGFAGHEPEGRWTDGPSAELCIGDSASFGTDMFIMLRFDLRAFLQPGTLSHQRVRLSVNGLPKDEWVIAEAHFRSRICVINRSDVAADKDVRIGFELPDHASPSSLGLNPDSRSLGIMIKRVTVMPMAQPPAPDSLVWQYGRRVGGEASKSFDRRIETGFWARFVTGPNVLDIGFRGYGDGIVPIFEHAIGVDTDYPGYDGRTLPFEDASQDTVFSSHCLEHIPDYIRSIQEWHRVTKVGGHIITAVPSSALYERKRRPPSRWNGDHKRFYTPSSLLGEFEAALEPNTYRVRLLEENDLDYRYAADKETHPYGAYEIVLVIEKIAPPHWTLDE